MNYFKKEQLCVFNYLGDTVEKLYQTGNSRESAAILQLFEGWVSVNPEGGWLMFGSLKGREEFNDSLQLI